MLDEAVYRVRNLIESDNIYLSTSRELAAPITDSGLVPSSNVIAEPTKRNTLGALVWLAAVLYHRGCSESTIAVLTSDHKIGDLDKFHAQLALALSVAEKTGGIVTLGIPPTRPETGFGYLKVDHSANAEEVFTVRSFHEKPSLETALEFTANPDYYWNSGMLFYTLSSFREALAECQPRVLNALNRIVESLNEGDQLGAVKAFESIPNISFDFAVMEHTRHVTMVAASFAWDDVGSWDAISRSFYTDDIGNTVQGCAAIVESRGCILVNDVENSVIGVIGLDDIIVVNSVGGVLVCPKSLAQRVREVSVASEKSLAAFVSLV
jgi:mannose-1-phosphate guanylyltransferase